jgi:hypothetical protein
MPYVGGSVAAFFGEVAQAATKETARRMCADAAESVERIARANTPVKTGVLRAAWYKTEPVDTGDRWSADIANDTDYAGYVENGTGVYGPKHAPYMIRPKKPGGVLRWVGKDGTVVFARYALHPGSPGNHMLEIAMTTTEALAQDGALFAGSLEFWVREVEGQAERQV